ncbi:MAG TPA: alpha/beta fold hydrolase, partial [Deltaproteobacteria bacterium]|nr:alpha/beta fold hydrolase [Deltaproteobacteria bacterium]
MRIRSLCPVRVVFLFFLAVLAGGCASVQDSAYDAAISTERMISGLHEASITVQGRKTAYLERPGNGETIVLLHGFGADKDNWVRFVRHLPEEYRVIAFDLPGHGDSVRDEGKTYTIDYITAGFAEAAEDSATSGSPLADYELPAAATPDSPVNRAFAGVVGVALTAGVAFAVFGAVARSRSRSAADESGPASTEAAATAPA